MYLNHGKDNELCISDSIVIVIYINISNLAARNIKYWIFNSVIIYLVK